MEFLSATELGVPASQMALLLVMTTITLFFGRIKLALIINYVFTLHWGYVVNREYLLDPEYMTAGYFTTAYFGFGLGIVILALIGFMAHNT